MKTFDLSSRHGRYAARKAGLDVPKQKPGLPAKDFWSQVNKTDGCWLWTGYVNRDGYGLHHAHNKIIRSHRYVLEYVEKIPLEKMIVMHKCDNPACCNPAHLAIGTHADNQLDKTNKNRQAKGESNGSSILTEEQVREMRSKYKPNIYTYKMLADEYKVNKDTVQKAVRGIYWKHLT